MFLYQLLKEIFRFRFHCHDSSGSYGLDEVINIQNAELIFMFLQYYFLWSPKNTVVYDSSLLVVSKDSFFLTGQLQDKLMFNLLKDL